MLTFITPTGRLVEWSSTSPMKDDSYCLSIGIKKSDKGCDLLLHNIKYEAEKNFPKLFNEKNKCIDKTFQWPVSNGDSEKYHHPIYKDRWVFELKTKDSPIFYTIIDTINRDKDNVYYITVDNQYIKKNILMMAEFTIEVDYNIQTAGMYLKFNKALFKQGPEIIFHDTNEIPNSTNYTNPEFCDAEHSTIPDLPKSNSQDAIIIPSTPENLTKVSDYEFINPRLYTVGDKQFTEKQLLTGGWSKAEISQLTSVESHESKM